MRLLKQSSVFLLIALFAVTSCSKYEEGPALSLLTKKARVAGEWKIDKTFYNGEEQTEGTEYTDYMTYVMEKDGTGKMKQEAYTVENDGYTYEAEAAEYKLEWKFNDDKTMIEVRLQDGEGEWMEWDSSEILKLKNKEFWMKSTDEDGNTTTTYLIQE